jgi:sugar lactone lactonase YvrE
LLVLGSALGVSLAAQTPTIAEALRLAGEGVTASERNDAAAALAKFEEAAALRPDLPRVLSHLAAAQVKAEQFDAAVATLERIAALGLFVPIEREEEFAGLRGKKGAAEVAKKLTSNDRPVGKGELAFALQSFTGLVEGIAWREKTGEFFFGDVNGRAVWARSKDGKLRRFTPESDDVLGVSGLAVDEAAGALWASTAAVPAMRGFTPELQGHGALLELDLETGAIRRSIALPRSTSAEAHGTLGDLALGSDGSIYITDTEGRAVWRLNAGGDALSVLAREGELLAPKAVTAPASGVVVVADGLGGLVRIDAASGGMQPIAAPANVTFVGIDGLVSGPGHSLFAMQADVRPARVLRIEFDPAYETVSDVKVVEAAHLTLAAPAQGCLGPGGDLYFVGNGGWTRFEAGDGQPSAPRSVPIFKTTTRAAAAGR